MVECEIAFAPLVATISTGGGPLLVCERYGMGVAAVLASASMVEATRQRVAARLDLELLQGAGWSGGEGVTAIGTGPGSWLILRDNAAGDWVDQVAEALDGVASVFDQSSGYALLRLSGSAAAAVLQKGVAIDFDRSAFPVGGAAVTVVSHVGVIVWRIEELCFDVAVFRSLAGSFWHWLTSAAAMSGLELHRAD